MVLSIASVLSSGGGLFHRMFGAFHNILHRCANRGDSVAVKDWLALSIYAFSFAIAIESLLVLANRHLTSPVSLSSRWCLECCRLSTVTALRSPDIPPQQRLVPCLQLLFEINQVESSRVPCCWQESCIFWSVVGWCWSSLFYILNESWPCLHRWLLFSCYI